MAANSDLAILVVNSYPPMLDIVRDWLRKLGFRNIVPAEDGPSALQKLREKPYGLILSDWNLSPMTGLQFLREVRADRTLQSVPFIMLTAPSKAVRAATLREAGDSGALIKPFTAQALRQKLVSVLGEF